MVNIGKNQNIRESRYSDIFSIAIPSISANSNIVKKTIYRNTDGHYLKSYKNVVVLDTTNNGINMMKLFLTPSSWYMATD